MPVGKIKEEYIIGHVRDKRKLQNQVCTRARKPGWQVILGVNLTVPRCAQFLAKHYSEWF